jgi:BASS family bile acid:Na+ symporter
MPADFLKTVLLPVGLILIMFGMGLGLTVADFKRVIFSPKAKIVGCSAQLLALPVLAFSIATVFQLPGDLATGLMLISVCPGGPTSNVISHLSRGDLPLSVTLTAISSVVTVFTIPLLMKWSMTHFMGSHAVIELPFLKTFIQLIAVTLLPIAIGMVVYAKLPSLSQRMAKPVNLFSILFLAVIIIAAVLKEKDLGTQIAIAGPAVAALNLGGMAVGFGLALWFGLPRAQRVTISIEVGIQNATLALAIALGILESPRLAIPSVVYGLFMFATGTAMIAIFGRKPRST